MSKKRRFKPCPFCGCEEIHLQVDGAGSYYCWCDQCGGQTREVKLPETSKLPWSDLVARLQNKAVWLWNRRAKP